MLFKEKKPNEYTEGRGGGHTDTHTTRPKLAVHRQGTLVPRQGPGGGRAEGQAGSLGAAHAGHGGDETGLGRSHTGEGAWHLTEMRPRPADTATGPGGQPTPGRLMSSS